MSSLTYHFNDLPSEVCSIIILNLDLQSLYNISLTDRYNYNFVNRELNFYLRHLENGSYTLEEYHYDEWINDSVIRKLALPLLISRTEMVGIFNSIQSFDYNIVTVVEGKIGFINDKMQIYGPGQVSIKYQNKYRSIAYLLSCNFKTISITKQILDGLYIFRPQHWFVDELHAYLNFYVEGKIDKYTILVYDPFNRSNFHVSIIKDTYDEIYHYKYRLIGAGPFFLLSGSNFPWSERTEFIDRLLTNGDTDLKPISSNVLHKTSGY